MATPEFVLALREKVGSDLLWMTGVTAVILTPDRTQVLLVRRADDGRWTPVTGIIDPGEEPARAGVREAREEADVRVRPLRLIDVRTLPPITYPNGDRAQYIDICFLMEYVSGTPYPADGENTAARFFPVDELPEMNPRFLEQLGIALSDAPEARFRV